ncbi:DUF3182 family protein [Aquabacter spiritensis]|nr:DUF3182 family protein [Aquabacter spiritensis]
MRRGNLHGHRAMSVVALAGRLAALLGYDHRGDAAPPNAAPPNAAPPNAATPETSAYVVPDTTLTCAEAAQLGIRGEGDLFGGVVPAPVVAGKAITHGLVGPDAPAPDGWTPAFGVAVGDCVLHGFTAFSMPDARAAARRLLAKGPVRLKPAWADGGLSQSIVHDAAGLDATLGGLDAAAVECCGLVLEENLTKVETLSIGEMRLPGLSVAYCGRQHITYDNTGSPAYGGSSLFLAAGGFEALLRQTIDPIARAAVLFARRYDAAADACFPGFLASRRNYDVVVGEDTAGTLRCGVLEQSWRLGGATGAELAGLAALLADPLRDAVAARCVEVYGAGPRLPEDAMIYYQGDDTEVGHLTKYAIVEA